MATGHPDEQPQFASSSVSRTISAASTNGTNAKASPGVMTGYYLSNTNAAPRYVKIYDKASAPTVGTDTPKLTLMIPGGAAANIEFQHPIRFANGIGYGTTTGASDGDTGIVAASEVIVNLYYI